MSATSLRHRGPGHLPLLRFPPSESPLIVEPPIPFCWDSSRTNQNTAKFRAKPADFITSSAALGSTARSHNVEERVSLNI
jgi:hypothetical protein